METETFHWINMDSRSAVALYEAFALSTRALPFSESAGKPSGWSHYARVGVANAKACHEPSVL